MINYSLVTIAEDQMAYYSPYRILINETSEMNEIADKKQRAKGETTYFDDTNPDNDDEGWYNFYFDTNGKEVIQFYYEYMGGSYGDSIEMTDEEKKNILEQLMGIVDVELEPIDGGQSNEQVTETEKDEVPWF